MKTKLAVTIIMFAMTAAATVSFGQPPVQAPAQAPAGQAPGARGGMGGFGMQQTPPGPPAPVPAAVAMLRPTEAEVATINAELKKFVDIGTSSNKDLLKKYASLISISVPRDNPCIRPTAARGGRHESFVEIAKNGDFDILFYGDSITDLLNSDADPQGNPGGKPAFDKNFAGMKVANFGISGDTTQGVLWRLQNGEGQGHKPKAVMVMIGTNNMNATTSGAEVAEGIGAIVLELRKDFPDARILLMAIFPRGADANDANRKKVEDANKIIAKLHDGQHVFFMSINDKFLNAQGGLIGFRPTDNLHPISEGFEIWMSSVAPTLKGWVK